METFKNFTLKDINCPNNLSIAKEIVKEFNLDVDIKRKFEIQKTNGKSGVLFQSKTEEYLEVRIDDGNLIIECIIKNIKEYNFYHTFRFVEKVVDIPISKLMTP